MILKKKKTEKSNLGILGGGISRHHLFSAVTPLPVPVFEFSRSWLVYNIRRRRLVHVLLSFFIFDLGVECMTRRDHLHAVFGATLSPITDLPTLESI